MRYTAPLAMVDPPLSRRRATTCDSPQLTPAIELMPFMGFSASSEVIKSGTRTAFVWFARARCCRSLASFSS